MILDSQKVCAVDFCCQSDLVQSSSFEAYWDLKPGSVAQEFWLQRTFELCCILLLCTNLEVRQIFKHPLNCFYSEPCLRKCLSVPPLPTECDKPMQRDNLPALSALDLHGSYWEIPKSTSSSISSSSHHHPHITPSSPQQVCFFVSSQDEPHSHAQQ